MSATLAPAAEPRRATYVKRPRRTLRSRRDALEPIAVFLVAFAAYVVLGWQITLERHVVPGDGLSRLAHAFFVFYNVPHKLTAIGFVWAPLETMVFLPLAAIKPLATSYWALPLTSAIFGAALLVSVARWLRASGMPAWQRLSLVALLAINPMIAHYSSNGMGDIVSLWLLTGAVVAFARWYADRNPRQLIFAGFFLALGSLVRYEIALWALLLAPAVVLIVSRRSPQRAEAEASAVTLLVPVVYALGVWSFFNWTILGHPLSWLNSETDATFAQTRGSAGHISVADAVHGAFSVSIRLFPVTFVVIGALLVVALRRRSSLGVVLAAALLLNAVATAALAYKTQAPNVFQLRYNMRAMPLSLVGIGWIYAETRAAGARIAVWAAAGLMLAATLPLTWHTMATDPVQFREQQFVHALSTGRDQQGTRVIASTERIAVTQDFAMARYIVRHVHGRNRILTDDAQSFGVMLRSGEPSLFFDRIDRGDAVWTQVAEVPFRHVSYMLITSQGGDLLNRLYPKAYGGGQRGLRLVYATTTSRLFRVVGPVR